MIIFLKKSILFSLSFIMAFILSMGGIIYGYNMFNSINETLLILLFTNYSLNPFVIFLYSHIKIVATILSLFFLILLVFNFKNTQYNSFRKALVSSLLGFFIGIFIIVGYENNGFFKIINYIYLFTYYLLSVFGFYKIFTKKGERNDCT